MAEQILSAGTTMNIGEAEPLALRSPDPGSIMLPINFGSAFTFMVSQ